VKPSFYEKFEDLNLCESLKCILSIYIFMIERISDWEFDETTYLYMFFFQIDISPK